MSVIPTPLEREQEFHAVLVRTGLRPQGSKVEDYRPKAAHLEVQPEAPTKPIKFRSGELADV